MRFSAILLLCLATCACAVSGSVGTATMSSDSDTVQVRSSHWGGTLACGTGEPGAPPCATRP